MKAKSQPTLPNAMKGQRGYNRHTRINPPGQKDLNI